MISMLAAIVFGIVSTIQLQSWFFVFFSITIILLCLFLKIMRKRVPKQLIIFTVFYIISSASLNMHAHFGMVNMPYGERVIVRGTVHEFPSSSEFSDFLFIKAEDVTFLNKKIKSNANIIVSVYKGAGQAYRIGDQVEVFGKLERIHGADNFGDFDYNLFYRSKNVYARIIAAESNVTVLDNQAHFLKNPFLMLRRSADDLVNRYFTGDTRAIIKSMIIGNKTEISDEVEGDLKASGLMHVIAVSGTHISAFLVIVVAFLSIFGLGTRKRIILSMILVVAFTMFTGSSISAVRACVMCVAYQISQLYFRDYSASRTVILTASAMMLLNPYVLYDVGFIYTTLCVFAIDQFFPLLEKEAGRFKAKKLSLMVFSMLSAQIAAIPVTAFYFGYVSTYALVANLIIAVFATPIILFGVLFSVLGGLGGFIAYPLNFISDILIKIMLYVAKAVANIPFAVIYTKELDLLFILFYVATLYAIYHGWKYRKTIRLRDHFKVKAAATVSVILLAFMIVVNITSIGVFEVTFLNVGQGDTAYIKTAMGKNMLIDAGGSSDSVGENTILPYLRRKGVTKLDAILLSHFDRDHSAGVMYLLQNIQVDSLMIPDTTEDRESKNEIIALAESKGTHVITLLKGNMIKDGKNMVMSIISPDEELRDVKDYNEASMVVMLSYGEMDFLFCGDIGAKAEEHLSKIGGVPSVEVLKVAHHGSKNSSTEEFLEAVAPEYAVISVGKNSYGHPAQQTLARLEVLGSKILRTDEKGTIVFEVAQNRIKKIKTLKGMPQ